MGVWAGVCGREPAAGRAERPGRAGFKPAKRPPRRPSRHLCRDGLPTLLLCSKGCLAAPSERSAQIIDKFAPVYYGTNHYKG